MMKKNELAEIRKKQSKKLEQLLSSPKKVERAAKKQYGNRWEIIYSGENHPNNKSKR
jgi:hypothetical protein